MGRQLDYSISEELQEEFNKFLIDQGFDFLATGACNEITYLSPEEMRKNVYVYLYKKEYGNIQLRDTGKTKYIDGQYNPVMEYSKSRIKVDKKRIIRGAVWRSTDFFYDENANEELFKKDYNMLIRWLKKHLIYTHVKGRGCKEYVDDKVLRLVTEEDYRISSF